MRRRPTSPVPPDEVHPGEVLVRAARRGDGDGVLRAGCRIALSEAELVGSCAGQLVKSILQCRPGAIPALAVVLRDIAERHGSAAGPLSASMLRHMPRDAQGFKVMSVMAEAGFDLAGCGRPPGNEPDLCDHQAHLAGLGTGTLDEVCALLARSPLEPFHGRRYGRFPGDLALWRPLRRGRYGVPWALPPSLAVLGLAAAAVGMVVQGLLG